MRKSPEQSEDPRAYPRDGEHPEREGIEEDVAVHDLRDGDGGRIGEEGEDEPCREPGKGERRGLGKHGLRCVLRSHARKAQDVQLPPSFPRGYDDEVGKSHRRDDVDDDGEHGEHVAGVSRRGSLDGEVAFAGVEGDVGAVYLFAQFRKPRRVAVKMQENDGGERAHILCDEVVAGCPPSALRASKRSAMPSARGSRQQ